MANDNDDALTTGALVLGGGAAGYAAGRWMVARWLDNRPAPAPAALPTTVAPIAGAAASLALPATTSSAPTAPSVAPPTTYAPAAPRVTAPAASTIPRPPTQAHAAPSKPRPRPRPRPKPPGARPVSHPSQVDDGAYPVSSPSQVDPTVAAPAAAVATGTVRDPYPTTPELAAPTPTATPTGTPIDPYPDTPATKPTGTPIDPYPDTPATAPTGTRLSRRFDPTFETYRTSIPIEFLRALAMRESGMNPASSSGPAWGLMQIIEAVRLDYNKAHKTKYTREHLLDPAVSVAMGCWLLRTIIKSYHRNHPDAPNLRADWSNPRFAELVVFGWNAGYSEKGGVGLVAHHLAKKGIEITIDTIHQHAAAAGASRHLRRADKVKWCKGVVALYARDRQPWTSPHRGVSWADAPTFDTLSEQRNLRVRLPNGRSVKVKVNWPLARELGSTYGPAAATVAATAAGVPLPVAVVIGQVVGKTLKAEEKRQGGSPQTQQQHRDASWWAVKTPSVILDEMRAAQTEIHALGRDIYATFRRPWEAQLAAAQQRFRTAYGREPGVGRQADDVSQDYPTVRAWMQPAPTDADWAHKTYQGQFVHQWSEFERAFDDFWAEHADSWTDRMWRGTFDRAVEYRKRAIDWRKRFEAMGGTPTTPTPTAPTEPFLPEGVSIDWKTIALVGGVAAGALFVVPAAINASRR